MTLPSGSDNIAALVYVPYISLISMWYMRCWSGDISKDLKKVLRKNIMTSI